MENNLENKAMFFAQYWGQSFLNGINGTAILSLIDINDISLGRISGKLILKSLSSITDDHLMKVVEIVLPYLQDPSFRISKGYTRNGKNICETVICIEVTEFVDIIHRNILHALIQVDTEEHDIITGMFEDDGKLLRDDATDNILHAYDFLRSKGYALPFMGLTVEKQIEYGWIKILESEVSNG
ncbi:hypothetical protein [Sphingobacterium faecium]|uniref:hypothetical protein n=1 Tax=Sphingobacterium faecium TaxID=34087 RepID=UPI00247A0535|nr:hypothetical protein [Sphingobacterium faecium]WGQ15544.1 hypothetical protein QG727_03850 [Sphingobacterium faecium]